MRKHWVVLGLSVATVFWLVWNQGTTSAEETTPPSREQNRCFTEQSLVKDLAERQQKIEAKETELKKKEEELATQKKAIEEQLSRLEDLRKQIETLEGTQSGKNEERVSKLIETFEKMSPKGAASILNGVNDELAMLALSRIDTPRLAKILNLMDIKRSAKLSEMLTQDRKVTRKSASDLHGSPSPAPAAAAAPTEGNKENVSQ